MPCRLRREEIVAIHVLNDKGARKTEIARQLGMSEGNVRYHLKRRGQEDGRKKRPFKAEQYCEHIAAWYEGRKDDARPVNVKELHEHLVENHDYPWDYKSVLRYFRARYPRPRRRTYRRVETPPGAQTQTDWGVYPRVRLRRGFELLYAFIMVLSFSRMLAIVWSRTKDQLGWLSCHNGAYRRLGGIAAVNRVDNEKTAIATGAGAWGEINETYGAYAQAVGFHVDACPPRQGNAKGKAEAKVKLSRMLSDVLHEDYDGIEHLQARTDERVDVWSRNAICPATGLSVHESWERELEHLAPLPILPEPFDVAVTRPVHRDCMVYFENRQYAVPFEHVGRRVEVRGCSGKVQILAEGKVVHEYPRGTLQRVLIDPSCYEGESTDHVLAPPPLGKMGRRLQEIMLMPVEQRPLDLYQALAEVAR